MTGQRGIGKPALPGRNVGCEAIGVQGPLGAEVGVEGRESSSVLQKASWRD